MMAPMKTRRPLLLPCLLLAAALPALAQYKVVGPDGKVTSTDRPPITNDAKITSLKAGGAPLADVALPLELRQPASRFPVTLYTMTGACEPCDSARNLLRQRGIPFAERQVISAEDNEALERLSGGRDVPTLTIGSQILRGLAPEVWRSYLDAAGYPRDSRLPSNYQYATPAPITERRVVGASTAQPADSEVSAPAATPARRPGGEPVIKF
ncbi:hypothetical protein BH11PSE9_BH11PSE9_21640 [soil metagenome]